MVQPSRISDVSGKIPILRRLGTYHRITFLLLFTTCFLALWVICRYCTLSRISSDRLLPSGQSTTKQAATATTTSGTSADSVNKKQQRQRDMGFLHVGKTGGATLSRLIRRACFSVEGCQKQAQQLPLPESRISKLVTHYYHMHAPTQKQRQQHTSFLVTARDPIDRAASWYIFRHPANAGRLDVSPTRNSVLLELFACYNTSFDELITAGLAVRVAQKQQQQRRRCARLARQVMTGTIQPTRNGDHMAWNYGFYLKDILLNDSNTKELFVIRTEHLWEDWQNINVLLGGNGSTPVTNSVSHQRQSSGAPLPVHNKTLSSTGTANLCCALQADLEYYVAALKRAVNLNGSHVQESIDRLEVKCGDLGTLEKRCQSWDRGIKVGFWEKMLGYIYNNY